MRIPTSKPTPAYVGESPGDFPRILTGTWKDPDAWKIENYLAAGGYEGLKKAHANWRIRPSRCVSSMTLKAK